MVAYSLKVNSFVRILGIGLVSLSVLPASRVLEANIGAEMIATNAIGQGKDTEAIASQFTNTNKLGGLPFPHKELGSVYQNNGYLGRGSFGMSFLVTEKATGKQMVMKLLYRKGSAGNYYYTWQTVKSSKSRVEDMVSAAEECDMSGQIHEQGRKLRVRHPGAQRVMNCFGHNIPVVDGKVVERTGSTLEKLRADIEPLYLLLENCGDKDLGKFMKHMAALGQLTLVLIKQLFKQIMEGLAFLASLPVPYIHHDLKPENIVVKTQSGPTYSVHLIDFGGTTQVDKGHVCIWTSCTQVVAPYEYDIRNFPRCGTFENQNFDYHYPLAFDVYSAGCILTNLITGIWLYEFSPTFVGRSNRLNHDTISNDMQSPILFAHHLRNARKDPRLRRDMRGYESVTADAKAEITTLTQLFAGMLAYKARQRFIASEVLGHDWLDGIETVDDHDYQAALPNASASMDEQSDSVLLIYSVGDDVEVFSRTLFSYTGNGWTVGRVTKAHHDGRVEVDYTVGTDTLFKTLDQFDSDIRPLSIAYRSEADDDSISSERSVMGNFIPAKRRQENPLKELDRRVLNKARETVEKRVVKEPELDVLSTTWCPSKCWKCRPAIDKIRKKEQRSTYRGKYASLCYVPESWLEESGVLKIEDSLVRCSSSYTTGWKYKERRVIQFTCQDKALFAVKPK